MSRSPLRHPECPVHPGAGGKNGASRYHLAEQFRSQATTWQAELYDSQANRTQVMLALMPASLILAAATALLLALV